MSYYMIAVLTKQDAEIYAQYLQGAAGSLAGFQVRPLSVGADVTIVEGDPEPDVAAILEFADEAEFQRWWNSEEYAAVRPLRQKSTTSNLIFGLSGSVTIPGLT